MKRRGAGWLAGWDSVVDGRAARRRQAGWRRAEIKGWRRGRVGTWNDRKKDLLIYEST